MTKRKDQIARVVAAARQHPHRALDEEDEDEERRKENRNRT